MVVLERLLHQRGKCLLSHLDALGCRHGGGGRQEVFFELGGELAQAARFGVVGGRLGVEVLGDALQLRVVRALTSRRRAPAHHHHRKHQLTPHQNERQMSVISASRHRP
jgi:hypothetical protein